MAVFIRRNREAGQHSGRGVHQHVVRFTSRHFLYRHSRNSLNRRFEERRIFRYYHQKAKIEKWIEISRNVLCTLVFSTCILRMPTGVSILHLCLLRFAVWLSIFFIASLALSLCILYFQRYVLRRRITRAWKLMKRRRYVRFPLHIRNVRPLQRSVNSILDQDVTSCTNRSKLEHFLNIIANGFGQEDGLPDSAVVDNPVANFLTMDANHQIFTGIQCPGDIDEAEPASEPEVSNQTLHEANSSVTERRVNGRSSCHLSFIDFIQQLRNVDRQSSQQASISSQNETVHKYKEVLIEKVNLADSCGKITCAKELYEFIGRNWDEWFPLSLSEERTCDKMLNSENLSRG